MILLLYSFALALGLTLAAPWWLTRMLTTQRYREGLADRLGLVPAWIPATVIRKRVLWLHAVSVGEVLAATRLVTELEAALGPSFVIVISTTTRTGQTLARERFGADRVFYFPLDFAAAIRPYLRALRPSALILMESELWPRMLHECARKNIPVIVANARVSDRSFARAMRFRSLWAGSLRKVSLWLAQSEQDARRLTSMGANADAVQSTGNLKYDVRAPKDSLIAELIRNEAQGRPILVAGSTVPDKTKDDVEEEFLLNTAYGGRLRNDFNALLVIAPRHPERFEEAWRLAIEFPTLKATELLSGKTGADAFAQFISVVTKVDVVLLDTIGDLASVYGIADIAFVGGSLVPAGGHNPLEPAQFGVPIIMGPSYENFRGIVQKMQAANAIRIVQDDVELEQAFVEFLTNREAARAMGERGRQFFEQQQGATGRAVQSIVSLLHLRRNA